MAFDINTRETEDVAIVEVSGRLTMGEGRDSFDKHLKELFDAGKQKLLVDFSGTHVMDSQGIEVLVRHFTRFDQRGGALKLINLSNRVREVLQIAKLLDHIEAFDSEAEAMKSFGG